MWYPSIHRFKCSGILPALLLFIISAAPAAEPPKTLDWMDLVPDSDRAAWEHVAEQLEQLNQELLDKGIDELTDQVKLPDVLRSAAVRPELDGQRVRVPGFLVPLEYNARNQAVAFFLVPYFGACIHVPPPPPNQMVYIRFPQGIDTSDELMYTPFWASGVLRVDTAENELGVASYTMDAERLTLYEDD